MVGKTAASLVARDTARRSAAVIAHLSEPWAKILRWIEARDWDEGAVLMVFGAVIGVVGGLGVVVFYHLIDLAYFVFITWLGAKLGVVQHAFYRPLLTAGGLWAAWALVRRFRIPPGQNVADVQLAVAKRGGRVPWRPVLIRTISAAITLGSGGSAGSEGPTAVLGSTVGSELGRAFRFRPRRVKILVGCGAAAGIAAAFNAPFAGAFFALEEVLGAFSVGAFSPVVIASVVGALTVRPFLGNHPAFHIPPYGAVRPLAMVLLYPILGILCGLWSAFYTRMFFAADDYALRLPGPTWLRPVLGGLAVGLAVLSSGGLLIGDGHLAIPTAIFGGIAWFLLLGIALAKTFATSVTLSFGGSGGVFTPTLFIGAALGGGLGRLAVILLPHFGLHAEAWGLVGMAGLVAGATRAPLTAIFMVFEMTNDYGLVIPIMIVAVLAYATARRFAPYGLYDGWLERRGEHLAHGADRALMERIEVRDALNPNAISVLPDASLEEVLAAAAQTRQTTLPVLDEDHLLAGVITYDDLRHAMLDRGDLASILVAADLAAPTEVVTPRDSLRDALRKMNSRAIDAIPVVEREAQPKLVGVLSRADVLAAYERELVHEV
ncbi:MAG TPA: chloride channel protein [Gemmatimonadaceae bacterium]|nr:chloride channel protein [Gemmatimonadaceae bacterium]